MDKKLLSELFSEVGSLYADPRDEPEFRSKIGVPKAKMSPECTELEHYIQGEYFGNKSKNVIYQLGVLSSLAALRNGYRNLHGVQDRG